MILVNEIKGRMVAKGYTQVQLAKALEISEVSLNRKLKQGVFWSHEVEKLIEVLDIKDPMAIFFAPNN